MYIILIAFPVDSNSASHGAPPVSKRDIPTRKAFFCTRSDDSAETTGQLLAAAAPFGHYRFNQKQQGGEQS